MKLSRLLPSLMVALALVGVACGGSGDDTATGPTATGVARTLEVTMVDNRFEPATLAVQRGEKVTFVFRNNGRVVHDAYVGDASAQSKHEAEMGDQAGGHEAHGDARDRGSILVERGKTGTLTHTFDEAGEVEIGCHEPGHYAAGMKIAIAVS